MITLPASYHKLYVSFIRLACGMSLLGVITGILFQESTKKITYNILAPGPHWEAVSHLALVHGHLFVIGVFIPLALLVMLYFSLVMGAEPLSPKAVRWGGLLYHIGAGLTVLLFLYKGYHWVISVRMGQSDLSVVNEQFFGGIHWLRAVAYGLSHTLMSTGLGILVIGILKRLPKKTIESV